MKIFCIALLILLGYNTSAQKAIFVRVYNLAGKKIARGTVFAITDTSLQIKGEKSLPAIPVSNIGSIRTKHSAGNNILIGSLLGTSTMAIIGTATANPDEFLGYTAGEGAA